MLIEHTTTVLVAHIAGRNLKSGKLDYIPADLTDRVAPKLAAHHDRVKNHPGVMAYYAKHGVTE